MASDTSFSTLEGKVCENTLKAIQDMGFTNMTKVQAKAIPLLLEGADLFCTAKPGSGKTLAFLIPAIESIFKSKFMPHDGTGCIILSPLREIAIETFGVLKELMKYHSYTCSLLIGGTNRQAEVEKLGKGINFIVATPARLLDHLENTPDFLYKNLKCIVIDEADRMLDIGYDEELIKIDIILPEFRQIMLFSTTQTDDIAALLILLKRIRPINLHM